MAGIRRTGPERFHDAHELTSGPHGRERRPGRAPRDLAIGALHLTGCDAVAHEGVPEEVRRSGG
ncbi:hypothetical protein GCM10022206_46890 [Streptomyces chiangmaiensis]